MWSPPSSEVGQQSKEVVDQYNRIVVVVVVVGSSCWCCYCWSFHATAYVRLARSIPRRLDAIHCDVEFTERHKKRAISHCSEYLRGLWSRRRRQRAATGACLLLTVTLTINHDRTHQSHTHTHTHTHTLVVYPSGLIRTRARPWRLDTELVGPIAKCRTQSVSLREVLYYSYFFVNLDFDLIVLKGQIKTTIFDSQLRLRTRPSIKLK